MDNVTTFTPRAASTPAIDDRQAALEDAYRATQLARRLLEIQTCDGTRCLFDLPEGERERYTDIAASALAQLDPLQADRATYVAAHFVQDLRHLSPLSRLGMLQLVRSIIETYHATLAGQHRASVEKVQRFIDLDRGLV